MRCARNPLLAIFFVGSVFVTSSVAAQEAASIAEALEASETHLHLRARYEEVEEEGLVGASASTLRTRLSYASGRYLGLSLAVEMDDTTAILADDYSDGITAKGTSVIPDPETTEVNQAYIRYSTGAFELKYGRQRILLDNQRFVGGVGWRQDEQTFDGFSLNSHPTDQVELFASYISRANRIFAEAGDHNHHTLLLNGRYKTPYGSAVTYAYLIDNQTAAALSSDTFGLRWAGTAGEWLNYTLEYARQSEAGDAMLKYEADYVLAEVAGTTPVQNHMIKWTLGYELLGSASGTAAFATPLATLHAFQGWTDRFLSTPSTGIRDTYGSVGSSLSGVDVSAVYHVLSADYGDQNYGNEAGFVASTRAGAIDLTFKYARYNATSEGAGAMFRDTSKLWLMAAVTF